VWNGVKRSYILYPTPSSLGSGSREVIVLVVFRIGV
jgi:hypothetical protein